MAPGTAPFGPVVRTRLTPLFETTVGVLVALGVLSSLAGAWYFEAGAVCFMPGGPGMVPGQPAPLSPCPWWAVQGLVVLVGSATLAGLALAYRARPQRHQLWGGLIVGTSLLVIAGSYVAGWALGFAGYVTTEIAVLEAIPIAAGAGLALVRPRFQTILEYRYLPPTAIYYAPLPPPPPPPS